MRWLWRLCVYGVWLTATTGVFAQGHPAAALRPQDHVMAIGPALRHLDYKGVFTYDQGGQRTSQQWVHAVRNGTEYERLLGLDGAHREVVRERPLGCMQRSEKAIHSHLVASLEGDITALDTNYDFTMAQPETVAGRAVDVILIKPRDEYRFGYRLFADTETHLLLGADMINAAGEILEQFRFLNVHIGEVAESDLKAVTASPVQIDTRHCDEPVRPEEPVSQARWSVDVPEGYSLCSQEKRVQDNEQEDVLMYSDGLSHFTVFIRPQAPKQEQTDQGGQMQHGNTLLRSGSFEINGGLYVITVVGEIPELTAKRVMGGVKPAILH